MRGKSLELLLSLISNRIYFVCANGVKSNTKTVNISVPQGSTLGPLLFLIYVNDMINSSSVFYFTQFTDDTTLTVSGSDLNLFTQTKGTELDKALDWLVSNKFILNFNKNSHYAIY
ncbi:unnamed protein product [Meganyctiphanes norvegica]|uniref:Reverse transcriptase domain-containing protein n=1 Tax=Meganyctiphanes norvegica TaxID=48144 RepID=A0AAV2RZR8_MEGNR